jgi:hypothetical protein
MTEDVIFEEVLHWVSVPSGDHIRHQEKSNACSTEET